MTFNSAGEHKGIVVTNPNVPDLSAAALRLAHGGHPVIPLHGIGKGGRCTCGRSCASPGKHPRLLHGLKDASADLPAVAAWWRRWKSANIGLLTGASARLVVIDLDGEEGMDSWAALTEGRDLPVTREAITGGGGRHIYFLHPGGTIGNSASRLGDHVDVRGDGGYVVAPPSSHASGRRYEWANRERVAPCPDWLVDLMRPPPPPPRRPMAQPPTRRGGGYASAALAMEEASVRMAVEGNRNHTLNRAAYSLGQLVGSGLLDLHGVAGALLVAALGSGLGETEAMRTIESGLAAGQRCPRRRSA